MELIQVHLKRPGPDIWIPYPANFREKNPDYEREKSFSIGQTPCLITGGELELAKAYLKGSPQSIEPTGMVRLDPAKINELANQMNDLSGVRKLPFSGEIAQSAAISRERELATGGI